MEHPDARAHTIESVPAPAYTPPQGPPQGPLPASPRRDVAWRATGAIRTAVGWLALLLIFTLSMELTARVIDWVRFRMPILSPVSSEEDLIVRDSYGMHGRANARYRQWAMNSLGLRGREATVAKPPGTVRILTLGASETFGLYETPDRQFPQQLEDTLNARLARREYRGEGQVPRAFQVLNGALPGMSLPTLMQDFRNRLERLRSDIVVLYPTPATYLNNKAPFPAAPDTSPASHALPRGNVLRPRILADLRAEAKQLTPRVLLRWARRRDLARARSEHPAEWRFTSLPEDRLARYEADLRLFIGTVRSVGSEPVLATHANTFMRDAPRDEDLLEAWERFYPRASGHIIIAFDSVARLVTQRVAADSGVIVVDVARSLARGDGDYFADAIHFTDAGAAIVATDIADNLSRGSAVRAREASAAPSVIPSPPTRSPTPLPPALNPALGN